MNEEDWVGMNIGEKFSVGGSLELRVSIGVGSREGRGDGLDVGAGNGSAILCVETGPKTKEFFESFNQVELYTKYVEAVTILLFILKL